MNVPRILERRASTWVWGGATQRDFAAAAFVLLPFLAYLVALAALAPPTALEWSRADPILLYLPRPLVVPAVSLAGAIVAVGWARSARLSPTDLSRALRQAVVGFAVALLVCGALRLVFGPSLPSFIPAEESAGPGRVLNMTAGTAEEILFRLALLSLSFLALQRWASRTVALALACVVTGLAFALFHELAPAPSTVAWFVTRALVPGVAMSLVYLLVGPSFLVAAHCAAHVLIPILFAPPG